MITKKIYPEYESEIHKGEAMLYVTKMITEYRFCGILLAKKEVFTPHFYGYKYYEGFNPS